MAGYIKSRQISVFRCHKRASAAAFDQLPHHLAGQHQSRRRRNEGNGAGRGALAGRGVLRDALGRHRRLLGVDHFQMINALHREVNELKQKIASGAAVSTVPRESHVPVSPVTPVSPAVTVVPATSPSVLSVVSPDQNRHSQPDATPYAEEYVEESLSIEDQEKRLIIKALEKNRGRRKKAADELHISERTLYRKIKEYGLEEI